MASQLKPLADLRVETITSLSSAEALRAEWTELGERAGVSPSMTAAVALAWLKHLNKGEPFILTARDRAGRLVGLAPLHKRRVAGMSLLRWVGHGLGTIGELILDPDVPDAGRTLVDALSRVPRTVIELVEMSRAGAGFAELTREPRLHYSLVEHETVPWLDLAGVESAQAYLAQPGHRKLRQNLARADRAGSGISVEVVENPERLDAVWPEIVVTNQAAEQHNERLNLIEGDLGAYTRQSMVDSMGVGRGAALMLRDDGVVRGFLLCLTSGGTASAWLARFDPVAHEVAPGHQLIRAAIDWACERDMAALDLQVGDDAYKLRWASGSYRTARLVVARSGFLLSAELLVAAVNRAR